MSTIVTQITEYVIEIQSSGATGPQGAAGVGVPTGGTTGQVLAKNSNTAYDTEWIDSVSGVTDHGALTGLADDDHAQYHNDARGDARYEAKNANIQSHISSTSNPHSVTATQVGLGNVDNTSDANKPISSATQTALDGKVDENLAITGATKTKITYDAKGLVTSGADATTADINDSSDRRYVSDAQLVVIGNTSNTNTGDQDLSSYAVDANVVHKTGAESIAGVKTFTDDISLVKASGTARSIISAANATDPKILSFRTANAQRWALRVDGAGDDIFIRRYDNAGAFIDAPISIDRTTGVATINSSTMASKQDALGFTPENVANKETSALDTSTVKYPCNNVVKTANDLKANKAGDTFTGAVIPSLVTLTDAATIAVNAALGNQFRVTITASRTLGNPTGAIDGQLLMFIVRQDGVGGWTLTADTKFRFNAVIPSFAGISTVADKTSYIGCRYHLADDKFDVISLIGGY